MNSLDTEKKLEYNKEPVFYCKNCLSLRIRSIECLDNSEFCDECGSTNIEKCTIEEWENLYIQKFGHKFLEEY